MDLTVLDIGLRNRHISSVDCFFKIQIETFRLTQTQIGSQSLNADQKIVQNQCLYNDWEKVFSKLNNVISANICDTNTKNFAVCLARLGIQSCNQLLIIVSNFDFDYDFSQTKILFTDLLVKNIRSIRVSLRLVENIKKFETTEPNLSKDFKWNINSTEVQVFSDSFRSNSLVLGQYWLKKFKNVNKNWKQIIKIVIIFSIDCLQNNNFEDLNNILYQLGLPIDQIIKSIYKTTSNHTLRQILSNKFSENIILLNQSINKNMTKIIKYIEHLKTESGISLPICWISQMNGSDESVERSFVMPSFRRINDFESDVLSPNIVWNYLIDRNDCQVLNLWTQTLLSSEINDSNFSFDWTVTQDMVESVRERASVATREALLNALSIRGCFCSNEINNFQSILYRFGRIDSIDWTNTLNGFIDETLVLSKSSFNIKSFTEKLMEYSYEHNLNEFLYIYFEIFSQMPILYINLFSNLLKASINCSFNPSNETILENILISAQYVYSIPIPVTIKSLIERANVYLGLIANTYSSFSLNDILSQETDSPNQTETTKPLIAHLFKTQFPIIYSSFAETSNELSDNELTYEAPNIYSLLRESIPFDVTKMFCWQSMNKSIEPNDDYINSMVFSQLPHFSNAKLADLYGLKANLTFTYYLNQGRVVEAYNQFISNRKVLNSKSIELAGRRAALIAYNDTNDNQIAVSCILFQQLLSDDSTQTLLHLSVANIVMSFAADFLSLNARQQQTELSTLLKRSHYYSDKRSAAKLLQLTVTAINRKYKNFMNIQIEECFDWKIAVRFATLHSLELPLDLLIKSATADNWIVFAICCQLHQYPKESVFNALKHFNNECISDHLYKAFQSSHTILTDSENENNSRILNRKESQKRTTKHLRNVLYSRIGLSRAPDVAESSSGRHPKNSFRNSVSAFESDDMSIASESDYNAIETISVVSSSNTSDGEDIPKLSSENTPKDLFQIILCFQPDSSYDPRKPLMYSSIPLSNPILCLIACSADYGSEKFNTFSSFSCWLLASVHFEVRKQFCDRNPNLDHLNWSPENHYQMLDLILRNTANYLIFLRGLKLFNQNITSLANLLNFMHIFFCEKNYYDVQNLKSFQDSLWKYDEPINCNNVLQTKQWIQRVSVIVLTTALRNAKNHELVVLLRHYEFARIQGSFSADIKVHDFRKLYRLCQCLTDTDVDLPIGELLSEEIDVQNGFKATNERYCAIVKSVLSSLQLKAYYSEARSFANNAEIESSDLVVNEWTLRAVNNLDSFEFWEMCWNCLTEFDASLASAFTVFNKFLSQIPSLSVKCFSIFKCLISAQNFDNQRESALLETMLWKCLVQIESNSTLNEKDSYILSRIWSDIIAFMKSNRNSVNKFILDSVESTQSIGELYRTLDKIIENLLNNSCIEKAHEVSLIFNYNHQDLDIILTCDKMARGLIKNLSEAPLSVQLKTKAIGQFKKKVFGPDFTEEQKEIIGFIESISSITTIGRKATQRVLLYFKISCVLHRSYLEIESSELDDLELLKCLISVHSTANDALVFAKELIALNDISDENIASIICTETLFTLKNSTAKFDNQRESSFSNLVEMSACFLSLVRLLNNTTILGTKLLTESEALLTDSENNFVLTKLYVKAHECFSLACDVKGIALVLRKARLFITQNLLQLRDFNSILRLMTGIGRYSEMTYCFDLFKENNEFELLLSKRIEKAPQLRIALVDYLKGDKEVFPLVALRFCLFREIAETHEKSALDQFNDLKLKFTTNLMSHREQLETVMYEFIDAHESFSKAGCHSHAESCAKLAQLISLQIHYLANNMNIINMNVSQISQFIEHNGNFFEALVVAEAYQYNTGWVNAVFNRHILKNDTNYLSDYSTRREISTSFIEELIHKFNQFVLDKNLPNDKVLQMRKSVLKLIQYIDDYEMRFRMASKLNLTEVNHKMLCEESGAYLQDLRRNGLL